MVNGQGQRLLVRMIALLGLVFALFWVASHPGSAWAQTVAPAKPTGLATTAGDGSVTLSWNDPGDSSIEKYQLLQLQEAELTASDGAAGDWFGRAVVVDEHTAVTGANGDGSDGSAHVLTRESGVWSQQTELTASDGASDDDFGYSVAVDEDTAVIGAYLDDDNGDASGSAYVFGIQDWTDIPSSGAATTFHTVTGLTNGVGYTFGLCAVNSGGDGPASDTVSATPVANAAPSFDAADSPDLRAVWQWIVQLRF